jgi:hypothetical protein
MYRTFDTSFKAACAYWPPQPGRAPWSGNTNLIGMTTDILADVGVLTRISSDFEIRKDPDQ